MVPWIKSWFGAWRDESVVVSSPLPESIARERLAAGTMSRTRAAFSLSGLGAGGYRVVGRVGERHISLTAERPGLRNSWRPNLRGRLEPSETGSRFAGTVGWHPAVKAFCFVWLSPLVLLFVAMFIRAAVLTVIGDVTSPDLLACLIPLPFILAFVGITALGVWSSRREGAYLRSWLDDQLHNITPGSQPQPDQARR